MSMATEPTGSSQLTTTTAVSVENGWLWAAKTEPQAVNNMMPKKKLNFIKVPFDDDGIKGSGIEFYL
jgi:hypothetical protein